MLVSQFLINQQGFDVWPGMAADIPLDLVPGVLQRTISVDA